MYIRQFKLPTALRTMASLFLGERSPVQPGRWHGGISSIYLHNRKKKRTSMVPKALSSYPRKFQTKTCVQDYSHFLELVFLTTRPEGQVGCATNLRSQRILG